MDKDVIFDTSYGTLNMGDFIINDSAMKEIEEIIDGDFIVRVGTHNPVAHFYQLIRKRKYLDYFDEAKYKFLLGTNILKLNMLHISPDWNVNIFNCRMYKNTILVGAGCGGSGDKINLYTKALYKKILNPNAYHATRDERTKKILESMGFKAINTGCPTMWDITSEMCKKITEDKAKDVVFTLTDYAKDDRADQNLIDVLIKNYENVYFWVQGAGDLDYLNTFKNIENIKIIAPTFEKYQEFLETHDVDYIGTRLHAGIYAIKKLKRSVIVIVDNRAKDIKENYNLNVITRDKISSDLGNMINEKIKTDIKMDFDKINKWKDQFKK